jgi:hypothetical protein
MKPFVLTLLRTILFCLAAWLTGASDAPVVAASEIPPISSQTYSIDVTSSGRTATDTDPMVLGPESPEHAFNGIQLTWTVVGDPTLLRLELITQRDGVWGEWMEVPHEDEFLLDDAPAGTQTSTIYTIEPVAQAWQIRITTTDATLGTVSSIRVTTMDTRDQTDARSELPAATEPLSAGAKPAIVARATWGDKTVKRWDANGSAALSTEATWMPTDAEIAKPTHLVIHHTATPNAGPGSDWPARVRQIWGFHSITNNWGDIGYHFLIDPNGVIYEGRYQGLRADGTVIDGAHSKGFNRGTIGIAMLGTFESVAPTEQSQAALDNLVAYLMTRHRIQPDTTAFYAHQRITLNTLVGHRDAHLPGNGTACPGNTLYALLPSIRLKARAAVGTAPAQQWLTGVTVTNTDVMVGDSVVFRMIVRNAYADAPISGGAFAFPASDNSHVYQLNECWAKQNAGGAPLFPKASVGSNRYARFRVMAGVKDWDIQYAKQPVTCPVSSTENHPWRWSIGATPLAAGQTRVISGGVRFTKPGTYTVSFGVMKDWIGYPDNACSDSPTYAACTLFPKTITVRMRTTPMPTRPPALRTQLARETATAVRRTATAGALVAQATQTALLAELTATAAATMGLPTATASLTATASPSATAIPLQKTAQHLAAATSTALASRTEVPTVDIGTVTATRTQTATRTATPAPFASFRPRTLLTRVAALPVTTLAASASGLVALEGGSPPFIALYQQSTLKRVQRIAPRGSTASILVADSSLPDVFYVAGTYTPQFIYIQRFTLVSGTLRETGYWLTEFTGTPTALLANGSRLLVSVSNTAKTIHRLIHLNATGSIAEVTARTVLPGVASQLIDGDGVAGQVTVAGQLTGAKGFLLPVTYMSDAVVRTGTRLTTTTVLKGFCRTWRFVAAVPVAQLHVAVKAGIHMFTQDLNTGALRGNLNTGNGEQFIVCTDRHPDVLVRINPSTGTLTMLQTLGTAYQLRATAQISVRKDAPLLTSRLYGDTLYWTDGISIGRAIIQWPR